MLNNKQLLQQKALIQLSLENVIHILGKEQLAKLMKVYAIKVEKKLMASIFGIFLSYVSDEKRKKIKELRRREDANRTLLADILIRSILIEDFNLKNEEILLKFNIYGKPYLEPNVNPAVNFNVSHSADWVICAVDTYEIGVDIQKIDGMYLNIAKRFFAKEEFIALMEKNESERISYFYDLWTLKESYIKACGKGLSIALNSFAIKFKEKHIFLQTDNEFKTCFFKQYNDFDQEYKMAVCSFKSDFPQKVTLKTTEDLIRIMQK